MPSDYLGDGLRFQKFAFEGIGEIDFIFDIAAAARSQLGEVVNALRTLPEHVARTRERMEKLNPEFVGGAIAQLMIMPDYEGSAADSLVAAIAVLDEVLASLKEPDRLTVANNRGRGGFSEPRRLGEVDPETAALVLAGHLGACVAKLICT